MDIGFLESLLRRGVYLQFDLLGSPFVGGSEINYNPNVDAIVVLITRGYADRLLFAHDFFVKYQMTRYGGVGLTFVHGHLIPYLLKKGIHKIQIEKIMVQNPRRLLTFVTPQAMGVDLELISSYECN